MHCGDTPGIREKIEGLEDNIEVNIAELRKIGTNLTVSERSMFQEYVPAHLHCIFILEKA